MKEVNSLQPFLNLEASYYKVTFRNRTYGLRIEISEDGRRRKLFAEELGGKDVISCNLYLLKGGKPLLKPCEMPAPKVLDFLSSFELQTDKAEIYLRPPNLN